MSDTSQPTSAFPKNLTQEKLLTAVKELLERNGANPALSSVMGVIRFHRDPGTTGKDFYVLGQGLYPTLAFNVIVINESDNLGILDLDCKRDEGHPELPGMGRRIAVNPRSTYVVPIDIYALSVNGAMRAGSEPTEGNGNLEWSGYIIYYRVKPSTG